MGQAAAGSAGEAFGNDAVERTVDPFNNPLDSHAFDLANKGAVYKFYTEGGVYGNHSGDAHRFIYDAPNIDDPGFDDNTWQISWRGTTTEGTYYWRPMEPFGDPEKNKFNFKQEVGALPQRLTINDYTIVMDLTKWPDIPQSAEALQNAFRDYFISPSSKVFYGRYSN